MEKSNIIIRIPEPCHEDWNKMLPDDKGKFCNSCNKSVVDFSNKTDTQIKDILLAHKDQKVCGHFKKSQVDRPLNLTIDLHALPKNMSVTKMFTIALFISFGTFLFSCTDNLGKTVGEISIAEPTKTEKTENKEIQPLVGQIAAIPPDSLEEIQCVEPFENIETVDGEIETVAYNHVAGGISIEHVIPEEKLTGTPLVEEPAIDTPIVEVPKPEEMIVGLMVYVPEKVTPTNVVDTLPFIEINEENKGNDNKVIRSKSDFVVFPNPTKGEFTVKYDVKKRSDVLVEIVDIKGVTMKVVVNVYGQHTGKYQVPVDLSDLVNGVYFVNLTSDGERRTQKVILEK